VNPADIRWSTITERNEARKHPFREFTCTEPRPKSPEGRTLPHPKPWEWTAQGILRQSSQCLKAGNLLVVGRSESANEILAVAHVVSGRGWS